MNIYVCLLIIGIVFLVYKYHEIYYLNKRVDGIDEKDKEYEGFYDLVDNVYDTPITPKPKSDINLYFTEVQFHNDYRDTMNAFTMLTTTSQTQLFNRSDLPITNISTPAKKETKYLVKNFIKTLNNTIDKVPSELGTKDWRNNYNEKYIKSGWDKQQEKLGLPGSLYAMPAKKSHVKLIKIDNAEKYETENDVRYSIFMIIQKPNVDDQMLLKVNFYADKNDYNIDREFFDKNKNAYEIVIKLEEISIIGYFTKISFGKPSARDNYHNFNEKDEQAFSQKQIFKELNKKRKQYNTEIIG